MEKVTHFTKDGIVRNVDAYDLPKVRYQPKAMRIEDIGIYRQKCLKGESHPLGIESYNYQLVIVEEAHINESVSAMTNAYGYTKFSQDEVSFIESVARRPHVEWAVDNSFDGLYVMKYFNPSAFGDMFKFGVYLKDELATFWNLKYSK